MKNIITKIFLLFVLLTSMDMLACHNSTINSVTVVDNGNGTKTYTINVSIDVGSSDGYSYGFALLFKNSTGTAPTITSMGTTKLTRASFDDLIGHFGATIRVFGHLMLP